MDPHGEKSKKRKRKHAKLISTAVDAPAAAPVADQTALPPSHQHREKVKKRRKTSHTSDDEPDVDGEDTLQTVEDASSDEDVAAATNGPNGAHDDVAEASDDGESSDADDDTAGPELEETVNTVNGTTEITATSDLPTDTVPSLPGTETTPQKFSDLSLSERTMKALKEMSFTTMTEIQQRGFLSQLKEARVPVVEFDFPAKKLPN